IYYITISPFRPGPRGAEPIVHPLVHVPEHVREPQVVGQQAPAQPGMLPAVGLIAGILAEQVGREAVVAARDRARTAGVFPLRLRRPPAAGPSQTLRRAP